MKQLRPYVHDIEHIGSTAVPNLPAKPVIDMVVSVDDLYVYHKIKDKLIELGYEFMPERVFDDRVFFPKGPKENRTHHLSLVIKNSNGWKQPMMLRDYLVTHPKVLNQYKLLKEQLANKYGDDRASYTSAKADFIQQVLAKTNSTKE